MVNILMLLPNHVNSVAVAVKHVSVQPNVSNALILSLHRLMGNVGRLVLQDQGEWAQNVSVPLELSIWEHVSHPAQKDSTLLMENAKLVLLLVRPASAQQLHV